MLRRRRATLLVLAALGGAAAGPSPAAGDRLVRVDVGDPRVDVAALARLGFDVTHGVRDGTADVVVRDAAGTSRLRAAGFRSRVVVPDLQAAAAAARSADRRAADDGRASALGSGRETYRVLADHLGEMGQLVARAPTLVRAITLPVRSVEGRPIVGVEIAEGVARADDGRPVFVVLGLHHAREWASGEVATEFARDLVAGATAGDARIRALLARGRVLVVPVVNPDGFVASREGGDANRRKNCAAVGPLESAAPCPARTGVDLNRNHAAFWGGNGASPVPSDETYRGPGPWSEPEARAVHELTRRLHVTGLQTLHNVAGLVLRPPGFAALGRAPDEPRLKALGDAMAAAAGYASQLGSELYEVTGATEDWNYVAQGTFGYTIELGGTAGFQGPYRDNVVDQYLGTPGTPSAGRGVREALLLAAEQSVDARDHAVLTGTAPAGSVLRLAKTFTTATSPVCGLVGPPPDQLCVTAPGPAMELPDGLDTVLGVGPDGAFAWHVNPSTRPFVRREGGTEAWTLTCVGSGGTVLASRRVVVDRGDTVTGMRPCTPGTAGDGTPGRSASAAGPARPGGRLRVSAAVDPQRARTVAVRGLRLRVRCDRACRATTTVTVGEATRRRLGLARRMLGTAVRALRVDRTTTVRLRLGGQVARRLAGRGPVAVRVTVRARPTAGGPATVRVVRRTLR